MERLLEHEFFEKMENEQKFDSSGFQNLLETIKSIPHPPNQAIVKSLAVKLIECQRAIYSSLLFHFDSEDLFNFPDLPIPAAEITSQFDDAIDEVLKKYFEE